MSWPWWAALACLAGAVLLGLAAWFDDRPAGRHALIHDDETCALCGQPALGYARGWDDERLCHDESRDCYHLWTVYGKNGYGDLAGQAGSMILAEERAYRGVWAVQYSDPPGLGLDPSVIGGWVSGGCADLPDGPWLAGAEQPWVPDERMLAQLTPRMREQLERGEDTGAPVWEPVVVPAAGWLAGIRALLGGAAATLAPEDAGPPQDVPRPGRDSSPDSAPRIGNQPGSTPGGAAGTGPGHLVNFLSQMDDGDFWNWASFELRQIAFAAAEPFTLTPWPAAA